MKDTMGFLMIVFAVLMVASGLVFFASHEQAAEPEITQAETVDSGELFELATTWQPIESMIFYLGDDLVGTLSWETGTFKFEGDVEKSAQSLFDYIAQYDVEIKRRDE